MWITARGHTLQAGWGGAALGEMCRVVLVAAVLCAAGWAEGGDPPPKTKYADTLDVTDEAAQRDALNQLTELAAARSAEECRGVKIKASAKSAQFDRARDTKPILEKLIDQYCGYAKQMDALNLGVPLYVEVGPGRKTTFIERALKAGCRALVYEPSVRAWDRLEKWQGSLPSELAQRLTRQQKAVWHQDGAEVSFREGTASRTQGANSIVGHAAQAEPGDWWHSTAEYPARPVAAVTLDRELRDEAFVPIVYIDAHGWETRVLEGALQLIDSHRVQSLVFRLWPAGIRDAYGGALPKDQLLDFFHNLRRRGYYFYRTNPRSLHLKYKDEPQTLPECLGPLLDFLDHSTAIDAFGLWVDLAVVKLGSL